MSDQILSDWRDFIGEQIAPGDHSQTLQVLGSRINMTPAQLRAILDSRDQMQTDLWANISPAVLAEVEGGMYRHAREQLLIYWTESAR